MSYRTLLQFSVSLPPGRNDIGNFSINVCYVFEFFQQYMNDFALTSLIVQNLVNSFKTVIINYSQCN